MALAGQITVTTAGTAVQGTDVPGRYFILKAHDTNTGVIYVGNTAGDVASTNGFPLEPGEDLRLKLGNLKEIWVDSTVNGEILCWIHED